MNSGQVGPRLGRRVPVGDADELEWLHTHGACTEAGVEPDWFMPEAKEPDVRRAKRVCAGCPVKDRCLDWAVEHDEWGVWGGEMFRDKYNESRHAPELRETAQRLFVEGKDHRQVAELLDISLQTAVGYHSAWKRQQARSA